MLRIPTFRALLLVLAVSSLFSSEVRSQTILVDPAGAGGFETTADFAGNGWTAVNAATNKWFVGAIGLSAGARGVYISNNVSGTNNNYTKGTAQVSHFYRDIVIPTGATNIQISFKWRAYGESTWDFIKAYHVPTTVTPAAGTPITPSATNIQVGGEFSLQSTFQTYSGTIANSYAGSTRRLIFSWVNDGSLGTDPAGSIDEVRVTYDLPCSTVAAGTASTTTPTIVCSGVPSLSLTSGTVGAGMSYQWQSRLVGTTIWANVGSAQTTTTFIAPSISASTQYQVISTCSNGGATNTSTPVTVTVNTISVSPVTSTICQGSSQALAVTVPVASPQLLNATFNSGTDGFTLVNSSIGGTAPAVPALTLRPNNFSLTATGGPYVFTPGSQFLLSDADNAGSGVSVNVTATSPVINTAGATSLSLSFRHCLKYLSTSTSVKVEVYNGTAWIQVALYTSAQGTPAAFSAVGPINILTYANANMQVRFTYLDGWGYFWALDDVVVTGTLPTTLAWTSSTGGGLPVGAGTPSTTNNNISVTPTATGALTYTVNSNNCGSSTATVNVIPAVSITGQPTATQSLCAGSSLTLSVTASNAAGYQWYSNTVAIPGATASTYNVPSTTTANAGTYYVIVSGTAPCAAVQSGNAVVNINPRPTAAISGTNTICNGSSTTMSVTFTGTAPRTFNYFNGTTNTPVTTSLNPYTFSVSPSATTTYSITSLSDANCTAIAADYAGTAVVTVNPRPTAVISGTTTICNGSSTTMSVTFTGTAPRTFNYFNGTTNTPVTTSLNPYTFSVAPTATTTYSITSLSDANCTAIAADYAGSATVTVNQLVSISAQPAPSTTICVGLPLNLSVTASNATGYQWYKNTVLIPGATSATYNVPAVAAGDAGTYYVIVMGAAPCANLQSNNATVIVNPGVSITSQPPPTVAVCNGSALNISVTAANATGYQWYRNTVLIPGATSATYNVPVASAANSGTYYVTVTGSGPCATVNSNNSVVTVNPRPTAALSANGPGTVCNGTAANMKVSFTGTAPWTFTYYNGTTTTSVTTSANPYTFSLSPSTTTTYSITSLSDANCTAIAADYTGTYVVTVNPRPTAVLTASGPSSVCNGTFAAMNITFTGTGPWTYTMTNGTTTWSNTTTSNPHTQFVLPSSTATYSITSLTDVNCSAIAADITSTYTVIVKPRPTAVFSVVGPSTICNGSFAGLRITFTGTAPWTVEYTTGLTTTVVTTSQNPYNFFTLPTANTTYSVTVLSDANCQANAADFAGSASIIVKQRPTATITASGPSTVCNGTSVNMSVALTGVAPWTFQYFNGTTSTSVTTSTSPYNFTVTPTGNTTYSINLLVDANCVGNPADYATTAPILVKPRPTATFSISGPSAVCNGSSTNVNVNFTGTPPWTFNRFDGTNYTLVTTSLNPYTFPVSPSVNTTYSINLLLDANCTGIASDYASTATLTVKPRPTATLTVNGSSTLCDGGTSNVSVALTGTGPWTFDRFDGMTTTTVTTTFSPYIFSVSPSATTTYSITSLTDANCTAIAADIASTATLTVHPRPTVTVTGTTTVCEGTTTDINVALTGSAPWTFTRFDGNSNTNVTTSTNPYIFSVTPSATTTYSITSLLDANCVAMSSDYYGTATVTVNHAPAILVQPTAVTECSGTGTTLTAVATGTGLIYQWQLNGNTISDGPVYSGTNTSVLTINSVTGVSGTYDLMISGVCPPVIYTTPVTVTEDHNNTWSGAVDQNWSVTGNWSCGTLPIVTTDVLIPTNAINMPLVDIPTAICNSLTIDPSASVMFTGTNNALEIKAGITHNGTFNASLGTVILSGASAQNIPAITYKNLQIDGGSAKLLEGDATITGYLNLVNGHILIGGYDLTLDVPVQAIGGNPNSFIVTNDTGVVIGKNMGVGGNPDAAMFHVGITTSSYTPIMLENLGTPDDYSVRVIPNVFEDGYGVDPITVTNPVVDRTWLVDEAVAGGSYVNMNPYWNAAEQINGFDQTHVYVVHYTGGEWVGLTDSALGAPPAGTSGGMYYADADSIQSFSPFTVASIGQFPLAIKLSDISAANVGNRNRVNFSSASEDKGDVYNIERSVDGKVFIQIGSVKANGKPSTYTYWDATPVTGKNFYRLRLEDLNGNTTYSKIVSATVKGGDAIFSINAYPNPVEGKVSVTVNGDIAGKGTITVTDMNGKIVRTAQQITGNSIDIDLGGVAHGLYFIKYSDDVHNESIKVNKK